MARAPLPPEQRLAEAHFVLVGTVEGVREGLMGTVEADLAVDEVEKRAMSGSTIDRLTVHYRMVEAPPGMTGSAGQSAPLRAGARVRVFLRFDRENRAQLLEPNGWEPA